jgi:hypothetical protein
VVRLTSSWPWRCVGEAVPPSSKRRIHGEAANTWCCKNTLTQHHTIFKGLFQLHVRVPPSSAVSAAAGIVGRTSVLRTKREHKAISRTAALHSTAVATSRQTHRTVRDKAQLLTQGLLMPSRVSMEASAFIGCAPISCTRARHTDWSLAAKCGKGPRGPGGEQSLFLF